MSASSSNDVPWDGEALSQASYSCAELSRDGRVLHVLDQRLLPMEEHYVTVTDVAGAAATIRDMVVRGAPAIGITAAYGMGLAARALEDADATDFVAGLRKAAAELEDTRPTAVNLSWALKRSLAEGEACAGEAGPVRSAALRDLALAIHRDDVASCRAMGEVGAQRIQPGATVLTHCNAGALATGGYGTALGVIRAAAERGPLKVLAGETRPYLQGARLTSWELFKDGIDVTVVSDGMIGHCMQQGKIDAVVVGADRIAANGDVANKIGTYQIACLARMHEIPFYVAAPWSTVDLATPSGAEIPIEQRAAEELARVGERQLVHPDIAIYNPAFDVTPARLIEAIFTERGAFAPADIASADPAAG